MYTPVRSIIYKMLIKLVLITLILSASFVNAVFLFSGETDKMIRSHLLNALKRSYLREAPQVSDIPEIRESSSATGHCYPFDIKQIIVSEFLDFTVFPKISQIDCSFNDSLKRIVLVRLVNFHPHFATDNSLVNSLLYSVLNQHFRPIKSSNDPLFHDHLQLLAAKYFFDDLDYDVIPLNIYYYIICFVFEMIYETDLKTPNSKREFLNQFVYSLVMASEKNSLELSYKYVLSRYHAEEMEIENLSSDSDSSESSDSESSDSDSSDEDSIIQDYEEFSETEQDDDENENENFVYMQSDHLQFFYSKPSLMDIRKRFKIKQFRHLNPISSIRLKNVKNEFKNAILELFLHKFRPNQLLEIFDHFMLWPYYSSRLAERFMTDENLLMAIREWWWQGKYLYVYLTASKLGNMNVIHEYEHLVEIVISITPKNLIGHDQLCHDKSNLLAINEMLELQPYSLSKIDAWSKLKTKHRNMNIWGNFYQKSFFCEMLVKEKIHPLNDHFLQNVYTESLFNAQYARLFFNILQTDDPFICLYFPMWILKKLKNLIQDKFDLNKRYIVDDKTWPSFLLYPSSIGYKMTKLQSFSFKRAINSYRSNELKDIFSSNPEEFDDYSNISRYSIVKQPRAQDNVCLKNDDLVLMEPEEISITTDVMLTNNVSDNRVLSMEPEEISITSRKGIFTDNFNTDVMLSVSIILLMSLHTLANTH
jgi:hypothetical protein